MLTVIVLISVLSFAGSDEPMQEDNGIYWKKYDGTFVTYYQVDTICHQCFTIIWKFNDAIGITNIPCENLARRPEWKQIITWVDKSKK